MTPRRDTRLPLLESRFQWIWLAALLVTAVLAGVR